MIFDELLLNTLSSVIYKNYSGHTASSLKELYGRFNNGLLTLDERVDQMASAINALETRIARLERELCYGEK